MITSLHVTKVFRISCVYFLGNAFMNCAFATTVQKITFDNFGRLIDYTDKIEITCPKQDDNMGVLFVIGQSNACNTGEKKFITNYPTRVFNYYQGKCYIAASPLLGPGGTYAGGEFLTPLADELIDNGAYQAVIIVATAVPGSAIKQWEKGGNLNNMMLSIMSELASNYRITEVIWHQGEADFSYKTTAEQYTESFNSLIDTIRVNGIDLPPVYYAIATQCGSADWTPNNPIAEAQRYLANDTKNIFLGADTDSLVLDADRQDQCHFGVTGQLKAAHAYATAIRQHRLG
jgi:hypothetical protein